MTPEHKYEKSRNRWYRLGAVLALLAVIGVPAMWFVWRKASGLPILPNKPRRVAVAAGAPAKIVEGAHRQVGDLYDASYQRIAYPNGDVPTGRGACTDVVVRSLRNAGFDLQQLVHDDIAAAPRQYGIQQTDTNIDHRRVKNLMVYLRRHGESLPLRASAADWPCWKPGDIVCWRLNSRQTHIGVISDSMTVYGRPLVIHNCATTCEEDVLSRWTIIGHFRYPARG